MSLRIPIEDIGDINTAAALGDSDAVTFFLRSDPDGVNARDPNADGATPLFHAAWGGHIRLAKLLVQHGANVNEKDHSGETPIHGAAGWGRAKMVSWLISKGAEVNVLCHGYTPLHWAAQNGTGVVAKLLLDAGAMLDAKDHLGVTPLERARKSNNLPFIRVLEQHLARCSTRTPHKRGTR